MAIARRSIAPALLLLAPFVSFLKYSHYGVLRPEVAICLCAIAITSIALGALSATGSIGRCLALSAAVVLALDIQVVPFWWHFLSKGLMLAVGLPTIAALLWLIRDHADRILGAAGATIVVSTLLLPSSPLQSASRKAGPGNVRLPMIVHVVLDEHLGIDGFAADTGVSAQRSQLLSAYHAQGFLTFDRAYSEHARTDHSIAHVFNFSNGRFVPNLASSAPRPFTYRLDRNAYFSKLADDGYALHILQTSWLQLCAEATTEDCDTYSPTDIAALQDLPLAAWPKAALLASNYLARSKLYRKLNGLYDTGRTSLGHQGVTLPRWRWLRRLPAVNSIAALDRFRRAVSKGQKGDFFFAHLLIPHSPFLYDSQCRLRPAENWEPELGPKATASDLRSTYYQNYALQVQCATRLVASLLDSIPAEQRSSVVVIVQGDHGSRMSQVGGELFGTRLTGQQLRDNYSTLFAVHAPTLPTGSNPIFAPVSCLLAGLVAGDFRRIEEPAQCTDGDHVIFEGDERERAHRRVVQDFFLESTDVLQ